MKKITLLFITLLFTVVMSAQTTLSHSTDQTIANGMVACANSDEGTTSENNYYRSYTPSNFGETGTLNAVGVKFAMSFTDTGGTNPSLSIGVKVYTTDGAFPGGTLTQIAAGLTSMTVAENLTLIEVDFGGAMVNFDASDEIVVEIHTDSASDAAVDYRIAGNDLGEGAPTYIASTDCGIMNPVTYASLNFNSSHAIIDLVVDASTTATVNQNTIEGLSVYPNPIKDVLNINYNEKINLVTVFNTLGQKVLETTSTVINMNSFATGTYVLKIETNDKIGTYKISKQ